MEPAGYDTEFRAALRRGEVICRIRDEPRVLHADLVRHLDEEWARAEQRARRDGRVLFDGRMLRLASFDLRADRRPALVLQLEPTTYREFLGTNLCEPARRAAVAPEHRADPVGTSAVLVTRDGRRVVGRRSDRVSYHAGYVHCFGGIVEQVDVLPEGGVDVFASILREIEEETGVGADQVTDVVLLGMVRDPRIQQPELLFRVSTSATVREVRRLWEGAPSRDEHAELLDLGTTAADLAGFLARCGPIAPVSKAALELDAEHAAPAGEPS